MGKNTTRGMCAWGTVQRSGYYRENVKIRKNSLDLGETGPRKNPGEMQKGYKRSIAGAVRGMKKRGRKTEGKSEERN